MLDNPYISPLAIDEGARPAQELSNALRQWSFWINLAHAVALAYPFLLVGQFYACWLLAWLILGRQPRVSWDDPNDVLGEWPTWLGMLLLTFWLPAAGSALVSVVARLVWRDGPWRRSLCLALLTVGIWASSYALLRWDPLRVVEWWMD